MVPLLTHRNVHVSGITEILRRFDGKGDFSLNSKKKKISDSSSRQLPVPSTPAANPSFKGIKDPHGGVDRGCADGER